MGMDDQAARAAASALWRAWQSDRRIDGLAESCRPGSLDEGYRIQAALAETVGQMLRGWKIAATSAHGQAHLGISEPLAGRLFDGFSYRSGAELPAEGLHMGPQEPHTS